MTEQKLSDCPRGLRDTFAPHCEHDLKLTAKAVRELVSYLSIYATAAERLEGATVPKRTGEIIELRDYSVVRTVPVEVVGEVS